MKSEILDFRFGWRWLLPVEGCSTYSLYGFEPDEEKFWKRTLAESGLMACRCNADALLLNADKCGKQLDTIVLGAAATRMICVVASGTNAGRWRTGLTLAFTHVREYGLLPAGSPRVVVPLATSRNVVTALGLHRPGRWLARWGVNIARLLADWGIFFPLRRRVLLIAVRDLSAIPTAAADANVPARLTGPDLSYALYLGTAGDARKTVILPLGTAVPETILKVGASPRARQYLKKEACVLEVLRESPIANSVPKLQGIEDKEAALTLYQEYRPRQLVAQRVLNAAVIDFLCRLSIIDRELRPLSSVLADIGPKVLESTKIDGQDVLRAVWARLQVQADGGMKVCVHRSHGDFASWNCGWSDQGLFVYDWEESRALDVAFGDAFYFVVGPAVHVERHPNPARTLLATLGFAQQVAVIAGLEHVDLKTQFTLWVLQRVELAPLYREMLRVHLKNWE